MGLKMIYTVTLNPSLDYIVAVENFRLGHTNRTSSELMLPGGKGINMSIVLKNLGIDSTAFGFVAGFTGEEIESRLKGSGVRTDFIHLDKGNSRINLKLKSVEGTEINGQGPEITPAAIEALMAQLAQLRKGDSLFLAGSIPVTMPDDIYGRIMEKLCEKGLNLVVDAAGKLLLNVLQYHPFLIKPNLDELGELFGVELHAGDEVIPYAKKLQELGARNVLVSMAGDGAVLLDETGKIYRAEAPDGELKNGVGAGDSMAAGFMAGWMERGEYGHAFRMGVAAGSASAFCSWLATRDEIVALLGEPAEVYHI